MDQNYFDKLLHTVLGIDSRLQTVETRLSAVEELVSDGFEKMDIFLQLIEHNGTELTAMQSKYDRLEDGLKRLQAQFGTN